MPVHTGYSCRMSATAQNALFSKKSIGPVASSQRSYAYGTMMIKSTSQNAVAIDDPLFEYRVCCIDNDMYVKLETLQLRSLKQTEANDFTFRKHGVNHHDLIPQRRQCLAWKVCN